MNWFFYGVLPIVGGILLYYFINGLVNGDKDKKDESCNGSSK